MYHPWHDFGKACCSGGISILAIIAGNSDKIEAYLRIASLCVGIIAGLVTITLGVRALIKK